MTELIAGGFGPVQPLTPVGASGDYCTPIPDVAVAPDGTAIVAWVEGGPCWTSNGRFQRRLRVAWRAPGGQFAEPQTVATWRSGIQDVGVAIDASDHATLLWASAGTGASISMSA